MAIASLAAALLFAFRAIPSQRLLFWASWSTPAAAGGAVATVLVLAAVSAAGVVAAARTGWAGDPSLAQAFGAAVVAQGLARRQRQGQPAGASLALGQIASVQDWIAGMLVPRIHGWACRLTDEQLVAACSQIDRAGGTTAGSAQVRAALRDARLADLTAGGALREETREDFIAFVVNGVVNYEIRKPPHA
jgi:hypothetical protein